MAKGAMFIWFEDQASPLSGGDSWDHWRIAAQFLEAADAMKGRGLTYPEGFCLGHAIEAALKSYLLFRGVKAQILRTRKVGHDLTALLSLAEQHGLAVDAEDRDHILIFSPWFREYLFRYGLNRKKHGTGEFFVAVPRFKEMHVSVAALLEAVRRECESSA
jgi:hypothetical protein